MTRGVAKFSNIRSTNLIAIVVMKLIVEGKPARIAGMSEQVVRYNRQHQPASDSSVAGFC